MDEEAEILTEIYSYMNQRQIPDDWYFIGRN